jgi:hypothetical protein
MLIINATYWDNGFSWIKRGYEYVLWGLIRLAIAAAAHIRSIARLSGTLAIFGAALVSPGRRR